MPKPDYKYVSNIGKKITRQDAIGLLEVSLPVKVGLGKELVEITRQGDLSYTMGCSEHNASCVCTKQERAVSWCEDHLRFHHT